MPFPPGVYAIITMTNGAHIGRPLVEDRSLLPKKICVLPSSVGRTPQSTWKIKSMGKDTYEMDCFNGAAFEKSGFLYADLMRESDPPTLWRIEEQGDSGTCKIVNARSGHGWMVESDEELAPVAVRPVATDLGNKMLFEIVCLSQDD